MEGPGHSGVAPSSPVYYIVSNLGNTQSDKFVASVEEKSFNIESATAGSASLSVTGAYKYYIGYADTVPTTSDEIKALTTHSGLMTSATTTISAGGTLPAGKTMCICVPSTCSLNSILNGFDLESKDSFSASTVTYVLPNNEELSYTVYAMGSAADWNYKTIKLSK